MTICPIIVGAAQLKQPKQAHERLDPLRLISKACKMAFIDAKAEDLKNFVDSVYMININCWSYVDAPKELSETLGIYPTQKVYLPDGGNTPQMLVNRAAKAITSGESQAVLITGGESSYSVYRNKSRKIPLNWPESKDPKYMEGKLWKGLSDFENNYKFILPSITYAIFETALRAASGRSLKEHRQHIGKLFEQFSRIASKNPYSWNQDFYTAEEITSISLENRYINHPYTKRMCANKFVDQSGALIMTNEEIAKKLKIDKKDWVYLMGGADLKNVFNITQRPQLHDSPAAREGSRLALGQAGLAIEDIDMFDIYSCFPSIVEIIRNELGISENDPRDLTVTGGLPYFGGPWSNYSLHSIISTVDYIRKNPSLKIMVVANGGYNSKQSIGIYGINHPVKSWSDYDDVEIQESILSEKLPEPIEEAEGQLTIEGYTITYDRAGKPGRGIVIGRLENGARTLANIEAKEEILLKLEQQELVGLTFPVYFNSGSNRNQIEVK